MVHWLFISFLDLFHFDFSTSLLALSTVIVLSTGISLASTTVVVLL